MPKYIIGGLHIELEADRPYNFEAFDTFATPFTREPELKISITTSPSIRKPDGQLLLEDNLTWLRHFPPREGFSVFKGFKEPIGVTTLLETDKEWKTASYTFHPAIGVEREMRGLFGNVLFRNCIMHHQGIIIHASAIQFEGKGILFSAPSGTGKSTHARLWEKYFHARVLNDDCPLVRLKNGHPTVFGTPWSGSTDKFYNGEAPLTSIVLLQQSPQNAIRELSRQEAVFRFAPRCLLPYFDSRLMQLAMDTLDKILEKTPVYLLDCKPDQEAAEMVHQCVS